MIQLSALWTLPNKKRIDAEVVKDVVDLLLSRLQSIDSNNFPVCLTFVEQTENSEDLK